MVVQKEDFQNEVISPSEVKISAPPSEVEQVREAVEPLELVGREVLLGEVVVAETMELEAAAAMVAWVVLLLGEAMVEEANWCRRHSHSQDTTS